MTEFTFAPARRAGILLVIGLAGPTGSGKTLSALRLARGIAGDRPVALIDTEARRARHYADSFEFLHADLAPPFSPERYAEAVAAAVATGAAVVIVDSASHEHEGAGGLLDMHTAELDRMAGADQGKRDRLALSAWKVPKLAHARFLDALARIEAHLIVTLRAKQKASMAAGDRGRSRAPLPWTPIAGDGLAYQLTALLVLPPGARGVPDLAAPVTKVQDQHRALFPAGRPLTEATGAALAAWAAGGEARPVATPAPASSPRPAEASTSTTATTAAARPAGPAAPAPNSRAPSSASTAAQAAGAGRNPLVDAAWKAAGRGTAALKTWWETRTPAERRQLGDRLDDLKSFAADIDRDPPAGARVNGNGTGAPTHDAAGNLVGFA